MQIIHQKSAVRIVSSFAFHVLNSVKYCFEQRDIVLLLVLAYRRQIKSAFIPPAP